MENYLTVRPVEPILFCDLKNWDFDFIYTLQKCAKTQLRVPMNNHKDWREK